MNEKVLEAKKAVVNELNEHLKNTSFCLQLVLKMFCNCH